MAIDRNTVSKLGEYGYAPPTDAIGLNGLFPQWVADPTVKAQAKAMATYNPTAAKKLLTDAGFTYKGNKLIDPKGNAGLARHPRDLGLVGLGRLEPDHHEEPPGHRHRLEREARAGLGLLVPERVRDEEPDPALAERVAGLAVRLLQREPVAELAHPVGPGRLDDGQLVAHRTTQQATGLLNQWKVTLDPKKQQAIATQLEKIFLDNLPIVPLFIGPRWSTYSTKYFHCFNSPKNFYGDPIFTTYPDNLLSFTRICPGGHAGPSAGSGGARAGLRSRPGAYSRHRT